MLDRRISRALPLAAKPAGDLGFRSAGTHVDLALGLRFLDGGRVGSDPRILFCERGSVRILLLFGLVAFDFVISGEAGEDVAGGGAGSVHVAGADATGAAAVGF